MVRHKAYYSKIMTQNTPAKLHKSGSAKTQSMLCTIPGFEPYRKSVYRHKERGICDESK